MERARHDLWLKSILCLGLLAACFERPQTRFPHQLHLVQLACGSPSGPPCLSCGSCHSGDPAPAATPGEPRAVPALERCSSCHVEDAERMLAASVRRRVAPEPIAHDIHFSHREHLAMPEVQNQCVKCHAGAVDDERALFPPMAECLGCHEHQEQFDRNECGPCHESKDVAQLLPQSFMPHDAAWLRHHGSQASQREQLCSTCHAQSECVDCHDVTQGLSREERRPDATWSEQVHPTDFLSRHAMEAASQPTRCLSCHTPATCDGCHVERGVSGQQLDPHNPHPPGWVAGNPESSDFHGQAARRDLLACASCHDQGPATNCIRCHQVGGYGGNPHPRGWQSARSESSSMCRYCHVQ